MRNLEFHRFVLLCFCVNLALVLPKCAFKNFESRFFTYLGELSMPLYIFHVTVGTLIGYFNEYLGDNERLILYYAMSIFVSILAKHLFGKIKPFNRLIEQLENLKD